MSAYIPVTVRCDGRDVDEKSRTVHDCKAETYGRLDIVVTEKGKVRAEMQLPDGWISDRSVDYDGKITEETFCPIHGKEKQPWRY